MSFEEYKEAEHRTALEDFRHVSRQFDIQKSMVELALAEREVLGPDTEKSAGASTLATNLDRLRLECGYTFEDLAAAMDINKRTVIRHIREGALPWKKRAIVVVASTIKK